MQATNDGKATLRKAFKRLEQEVPERAGYWIRNLRHPRAIWIRIPVALLLVLGGIFSFLPVLGIWMLPLGLLLIASDVPVLRMPMARFTLWAMNRWVAVKQRLPGSRAPS
ncbi:hypothetical protein [Salinarimonas soli]|uniref:Tryptophan synthase subunit beta n=1 Tax=Salinarimonas soli TaxID=1638099 RepID=A0A5B2V799_9HYPH|nr:hypothetical protein [Salinarimonas soli]KAA2234678.1 hypothetical protein F0L46_23220 [Salinarimonas soli]